MSSADSHRLTCLAGRENRGNNKQSHRHWAAKKQRASVSVESGSSTARAKCVHVFAENDVFKSPRGPKLYIYDTVFSQEPYRETDLQLCHYAELFRRRGGGPKFLFMNYSASLCANFRKHTHKERETFFDVFLEFYCAISRSCRDRFHGKMPSVLGEKKKETKMKKWKQNKTNTHSSSSSSAREFSFYIAARQKGIKNVKAAKAVV